MIQHGEEFNHEKEKIGELEGKTARVIISEMDASTPIEVQGIDLKAGVSRENSVEEGNRSAAVQERKCRDCFEVRTQKMAEGTNFLQIEASLLAAATVLTGTVFLIISG